ncbi:2OG-Fe dioxygenase family protein [Streptomyces violaceusniger]|uniref:Uncharacterized protein n=1 Tax=Streptomyces violaceusniger TaxID=68280 RepID=A0A4D4KSQ4_STRVO|nr:hypothetical protein SVIO_025880 [Streptomyces violaceusniger]
MLSTKDDFVQHGSGKVRIFDEIRAGQCWTTTAIAGVCTLPNMRTITNGDLIDEPALEGVHGDGGDHTMTTYLGSRNMTEESAVTFLQEVQEVNGTRWHDTDPDLVRVHAQHRDLMTVPLRTLDGAARATA